MAGMEDVGDWARGLDALAARIAPRFGRVEPRRRARAYLQGLLAPVAGRTPTWGRSSAASAPCAAASGG